MDAGARFALLSVPALMATAWVYVERMRLVWQNTVGTISKIELLPMPLSPALPRAKHGTHSLPGGSDGIAYSDP